jgi:hypothetical protein
VAIPLFAQKQLIEDKRAGGAFDTEDEQVSLTKPVSKGKGHNGQSVGVAGVEVDKGAGFEVDKGKGEGAQGQNEEADSRALPVFGRHDQHQPEQPATTTKNKTERKYFTSGTDTDELPLPPRSDNMSGVGSGRVEVGGQTSGHSSSDNPNEAP